MRQGIFGLLFLIGLALYAAPARAAPCDAEWQHLESIGSPEWQAGIRQSLTYDKVVQQYRDQTYGNDNRWDASSWGARPADPVAALHKIADWITRQPSGAREEDNALHRADLCALNVLINEAEAKSRQQKPPGAHAAPLDLCRNERLQWANANQDPTMHPRILAATGDEIPANLLDSLFSTNTAQDLLREYQRRGGDYMHDREFMRQVAQSHIVAAKSYEIYSAEDNRKYATEAGRTGHLWYACMANYQANRPQAPRQVTASANERSTQQGQQRLAMAGPAKPQDTPEAAGQPNPKELYDGKPAVAEIANHCMGLRTDATNYGGFTNSCDFEVNAVWCAYHPVEGAWSEIFDCESPKGSHGGITGIGAHGQEAEHTDNAEYIYWFACRKPSFPKVEYQSGNGFFGHCQ